MVVSTRLFSGRFQSFLNQVPLVTVLLVGLSWGGSAFSETPSSVIRRNPPPKLSLKGSGSHQQAGTVMQGSARDRGSLQGRQAQNDKSNRPQSDGLNSQSEVFLYDEYSLKDKQALVRQPGDVPSFFHTAPDVVVSGESVSPSFRNSPFYVPPAIEILRFKFF